MPYIDFELLAKKAYHAYGETTNFKNYQGLPMPEWENLGEKIQKAWISVVIFLLKEVS